MTHCILARASKLHTDEGVAISCGLRNKYGWPAGKQEGRPSKTEILETEIMEWDASNLKSETGKYGWPAGRYADKLKQAGNHTEINE